MLPVAFPVPEGVNVTLRVAVCPALKIMPVGIPLTLKPGPAILTFLMVTGEPVEFVKLTVSVLLSPSATLPRFSVDVLALNWAGETTEFASAAALATPEQPDWYSESITTAEKTSSLRTLISKESGCIRDRTPSLMPSA
jgi:hypothetical protein